MILQKLASATLRSMEISSAICCRTEKTLHLREGRKAVKIGGLLRKNVESKDAAMKCVREGLKRQYLEVDAAQHSI